MVTAAKEVAWERVASQRPMPRSDPRAMRLTTICGTTKGLRVKIGDEELDGLVRAAVSKASKLSDAVISELVARDLDRDMDAANAAADSALGRIARLLQDSVEIVFDWGAGGKQAAMKNCPTCHQIALEPARMGGWACTNKDCPDFEVVKNLDIDEDEGEGEPEG